MATWGTALVSKTGVINNGETTAVINKKTAAICTSNSSTNNNHLNAVVGIVVASVAGVAVAVGEDRWATDTRIVESESRAPFSRREGEYIQLYHFSSVTKFLIGHISLTDVDTEINATSATMLIEVPRIPLLPFLLSPNPSCIFTVSRSRSLPAMHGKLY